MSLKNIFNIIMLFVLLALPLNVGVSNTSNLGPVCMTVYADGVQKDTGLRGVNESFGKLKKEINDITKFVVAGGLLTSVLVLIILFIKLGTIPTRPFDRRKVLNDIVIVAICTAGMGALGMVAWLIMTVYENGLAGGI